VHKVGATLQLGKKHCAAAEIVGLIRREVQVARCEQMAHGVQMPFSNGAVQRKSVSQRCREMCVTRRHRARVEPQRYLNNGLARRVVPLLNTQPNRHFHALLFR